MGGGATIYIYIYIYVYVQQSKQEPLFKRAFAPKLLTRLIRQEDISIAASIDGGSVSAKPQPNSKSGDAPTSEVAAVRNFRMCCGNMQERRDGQNKQLQKKKVLAAFTNLKSEHQ